MNDDYTLFLDMDGVLVDFESGFLKIYRELKQKDKSIDQDLVGDYILSMKSDFWSDLNWISGGQLLWETSHKLFRNVNILSSSGSEGERGNFAVIGKKMWLKKHIPELKQDNIFIVPGKQHKLPYSNKQSILVDDVRLTIMAWNKRGGYGILHNSDKYMDTIITLEDIATPLKLTEILKHKNI